MRVCNTYVYKYNIHYTYVYVMCIRDRLQQCTIAKCLMMWSKAVTASRTLMWKQLKFLQSLNSLKRTSLLRSLRNNSGSHPHEKAKLRFLTSTYVLGYPNHS